MINCLMKTLTLFLPFCSKLEIHRISRRNLISKDEHPNLILWQISRSHTCNLWLEISIIDFHYLMFFKLICFLNLQRPSVSAEKKDRMVWSFQGVEDLSIKIEFCEFVVRVLLTWIRYLLNLLEWAFFPPIKIRV